jgi:hypothetical protein
LDWSRLMGAACGCSRFAPPTTTYRICPTDGQQAALAHSQGDRFLTFQAALPMMVPRSGGMLRKPSMVDAMLSRRLADKGDRRGSPIRGVGFGREWNVLAIKGGAC